MSEPKKKVRMTLVGQDGNAMMLLGAFRRNARRQGWTEAEMTAVCDEARKGDYDHLLQTLLKHTEDPDDEDEAHS